MNKATQMLYHLEEHVIAYAFPKGMQHSWKSNGRVVRLTSKDPAILRDEWKDQMLEVCILHASNFPNKEITVRVFSDIPWGEINTEGALRVSTEEYSSWDTTFVLCEQGFEETAICTETFQFRKNSAKGGVDCLSSTIHWMESNKKQEFNWNMLPDPNQEDNSRTEEGNGK